MTLVVSDLANAIKTAINAKDKDGNPIDTTSQMTSYATAIIDTLTAGIVSNAPGTINGIGIPITSGTPPPANIFTGSGIGGLMALTDTTWIADMTSGLPTANPASISSEASTSTTYLMTNGLIAFSSITGFDTATNLPPASPTPGILTSGAGSNGVISGLSGTTWSAAVVGIFAASDPTLTKNIYNAISNYIEANAKATYASGDVVGVFGSGGGPLTLGAATLGTIS